MGLHADSNKTSVGTPLIQNFRTWGERVLALAFPRTCVVAGTPLEAGDYENISRAALEEVKFIGNDACPFCGAPYENAEKNCRYCRDRSISDFGGVRVRCAVLAGTEMSALIYAFKYRFVRSVARDMVRLAGTSAGYYDFLENAILVPVPLWKKRFAWRGFNQSELYARALAERVAGTRVEDLLVRIRDTGTQTFLNDEQRQKNIEDAFALAAGTAIDPRARYVVIDDVLTTGATLGACVKILYENGAQNIAVATFARAVKTGKSF